MLDFTQYYVFPWTITNFTNGELGFIPIESFRDLKLPMGQIGPERIRRFQYVFEDSGQEYFYGTHYMHLGVVIYYLVRVDPFCLFSFHFHDGWDHPNRMFSDILESWLSAAYFSLSDVKELVPQLLCLPECLVNIGNMPFAKTTQGRDVSDVRLGHWCQSARDFVSKMRWIFESGPVCQGLHHWIDLVFGFRSRGEPAIEAMNLFHPLCYTLMKSVDEMDREAAVSRIINYGQCPQMLFQRPHIQHSKHRRCHLMSDPRLVIHQKLDDSQFARPIADLGVAGATIFCCSLGVLVRPSLTSCLLFESTKFSRVDAKSVELLSWPLSCRRFKINADGSLLGIQEREDMFSLFWLEFEKGDVARTSLFRKFRIPHKVIDFDISLPHFLCVFISDRAVFRHDIGIHIDLETVDGFAGLQKVVVDDRAAQILVAGQTDVVVLSINGDVIVHKSGIVAPITTLAIPDLEEGVNGRFFATGHATGSVMFWTIDLPSKSLVRVSSIEFGRLAIKHIAFDEMTFRAVVATTKEVFEVGFCGSQAVELKRQYVLQCSICLEPLDLRTCRTCTLCHRFYCKGCAAEEGTSVSAIVTSICRQCPALRTACL
jgi:hypothetical protein